MMPVFRLGKSDKHYARLLAGDNVSTFKDDNSNNIDVNVRLNDDNRQTISTTIHVLVIKPYGSKWSAYTSAAIASGEF